jgi:hypothetical protein
MCGTQIVTRAQYKKYCDSCRAIRRNNSKIVWRGNNKEHISETNKNYTSKIRADVLRKYSNGSVPMCACCGDTEDVFLCIDHIDGGGNAHRRKIGKPRGGFGFYLWLIKKNYPDGFQVLCHNCNFAKHILGRCPHEK